MKIPRCMEKKKDDTVKSLIDLKPTGVFSFYGVVKFFKIPQQTRRVDYCMHIRVTDPSWDDKNDPLSCMLFGKSVECFPKIQRCGDVVRFHRVKMGTYNGKMQCQTSPGFAALVFSEGSSEPISTTRHYTYNDKDKKIVKELQEWAKSQGFDVPNGSDDRLAIGSISEIKTKKYFDLKCQVAAMRKIDDKQVVLKVWDGTKNSMSITVITPGFHPQVNWYEDLNRGLGDYIVDVSIFDDHVPAAEKVKPGDFIQLTNLHSLVPSASTDASAATSIELCLHHGNTFRRGLHQLKPEERKTLEDRMKPILKKREKNTPQNKTLTKSPTMSEFSANTYFNFKCQVMGIHHTSPKHVVLKVTDGTKPPNLSFLKVTPDDHCGVSWFEGARDTLVGHILDISIFDDHAEYVNEINIEPGDCICLNNLHVFTSKTKDGASESAPAEVVEICLHGGTLHNRGLYKLSDAAGSEIIQNVKYLMLMLSGELNASFTQSQTESQEENEENPIAQKPGPSGSQEPSTSGACPSSRKRAKVSEETAPGPGKENSKQTGISSTGKPAKRTPRRNEHAKELDLIEIDRLGDLKSPAGGGVEKQTSRKGQMDRKEQTDIGEQMDRSAAINQPSDPSLSSQLNVSTIADATKKLKDEDLSQLMRIKAKVTNISPEYASKAFLLVCENCNFQSRFPQKQHRLAPSPKETSRGNTLDSILASAPYDNQAELIYYELKCANVEDFELVQDMLLIRKAKGQYRADERKLLETLECHGAWMDVMNVTHLQKDGSVKYSCPICSDDQATIETFLAQKLLVTLTVQDTSGEMSAVWIINVEKFCRQGSADILNPAKLQKANTILSMMCSLNKPLLERPLLDITVKLLPKEGKHVPRAKILKCCGPSVDMNLNETSVLGSDK